MTRTGIDQTESEVLPDRDRAGTTCNEKRFPLAKSADVEHAPHKYNCALFQPTKHTEHTKKKKTMIHIILLWNKNFYECSGVQTSVCFAASPR